MAFPRAVKDPSATLDYQVDWSAALASDTISDVEWIVPAGIEGSDESHTDATATIWLSGGTVGKVYRIVCRVTTAGGRVDDRTFEIEIRNT